jgi:hypothetical protein
MSKENDDILIDGSMIEVTMAFINLVFAFSKKTKPFNIKDLNLDEGKDSSNDTSDVKQILLERCDSKVVTEKRLANIIERLEDLRLLNLQDLKSVDAELLLKWYNDGLHHMEAKLKPGEALQICQAVRTPTVAKMTHEVKLIDNLTMETDDIYNDENASRDPIVAAVRATRALLQKMNREVGMTPQQLALGVLGKLTLSSAADQTLERIIQLNFTRATVKTALERAESTNRFGSRGIDQLIEVIKKICDFRLLDVVEKIRRGLIGENLNMFDFSKTCSTNGGR